MLEKVRNYAKKWQMFSSEDCVIAGISGGADSVCLLLVLLQLQKEYHFSIVAVHVNHGLRGEEADRDEMFVKAFCEERKVPLNTYFADVKAIAKERKQSTEEAGREIRREFFEQARLQYKGTKIALAHHQNDNAETFLFRLARGTGLKGMGGMKPVSGTFIRPLLCVSRMEIEAYLNDCHAKYCVDATNEEDIYTRNLIRNQVLARMEEGVNSKTVEHINRTMERIQQVEEYLEMQMQDYFKQSVKETKNGYLICAESYQAVPDVLKLLLIKEVMIRISGKEKDLEEIHFKQTDALFEKQSGRRMDLPYDMQAKRVYAGVEIYRSNGPMQELSEEVSIDLKKTETSFSWQNYRISCNIMNKMRTDGETLEKSHTKRFDCDIIKNGISFRTRKQGDYITIHPDGRTQKLKTFFINQKIPQEMRDQVLLVADGSHILWIVGYRVNPVYQVKEDTKRVLTVHIDKGEEHGRDN